MLAHRTKEPNTSGPDAVRDGAPKLVVQQWTCEKCRQARVSFEATCNEYYDSGSQNYRSQQQWLPSLRPGEYHGA